MKKKNPGEIVNISRSKQYCMWIYVLTLSLFLFRLHLRWLCRSSCRLAFISVFPPGIFAWLFLPDLFLPVWWNTSGLICKCQWSLTYRPILITVSNLVYNRYVLWSIMDRINLAFRAIGPSLQTIQPRIAPISASYLREMRQQYINTE